MAKALLIKNADLLVSMDGERPRAKEQASKAG